MSSAERAARPARWPWLAFGGFLCIALVGTALIEVNGGSRAENVPYLLAFTMFGAVGALILSRDRRNVIGAMLLGISMLTAISFTSGELLTVAVRDGLDAWWMAGLGYLSTAGWVFGILPAMLLLPVLFPDGSLPSPRWRVFVVLVLVLLGSLMLALVFGSSTLQGNADDAVVDNPLYLPVLADLPSVLEPFLGFGIPVMFGLAVTSLVLRFRRAAPEQRQQIKWVVFGLVFAVAGVVISFPLESSSPLLSAVVGGAAYLAFPVSIGASVLRFRLYDLDVVVKKALMAGLIAVLGLVVYGAIVTIAGALTGEASTSVVFVVAIALGIAFRPAMRLARKVADRLVYGRRATPYEVLAEFSDRVGDAYATDDVLGRMAEILGRGVGAERAKVWLRVGGELRVASTWPDDGEPLAPVAVPEGSVSAIAGEDAVEVRDRDELLGALSVVMPADDPMNPAKEKLVRDLASQAGLALRNVRLVEELRASQRRIVAAQDEERRRLERNIHDGAQQQLVALAVKARLARTLTERDPAKAGEMLTQIEAETQTALEDLRDLARGIYPPLLADKGLAAALEAQARKAPLPVTVEADGIGRFPADVEAAAYFSCLEALQNVGKYAQASAVTVRLSNGHGRLRFEVADDGVGFDPSSTGYGTGLRGIADRLGALDGTLDVVSGTGSGTTVRGELPVAAAGAAV